MKRVYLAFTAVILGAGALYLSSHLIAGQSAAGAPQRPAAGASQAASLKTEWGEPDLQGIWMHDEETPLQRPLWLKGREFYTDDELKKLDDRRAGKLDHDYRAERGTVNDVAGAYNAVYHARKPTGKRTSL